MDTPSGHTSSRQNEILNAAFQLTTDRYGWSMAEIANNIGVSKTALYRHFRNKAEIEATMNEWILREICGLLHEAQKTPSGIRQALVGFFRSNPGYLYQFKRNFFTIDDYFDTVYERLRRDSPGATTYFERLENLPENRRIQKEITILKNFVSVLIASTNVNGLESMQDGLITVLGSGFPGVPKPDDRRLDKLETTAEIDEADAPKGNRLCDAIAASIREYGIARTTIETIAKKMGMAKSSLYFYGANKQSMLDDLATSENQKIISLCANRVSEGKTIAEQIYLVMMVQANYLILKPELIPVFKWIRYDAARPKDRQEIPSDSLDLYRTVELFPDDEGRLRKSELTLRWASVMSTSCILRGIDERLDREHLRRNIRVMFRSMMSGDNEMSKELK